MKRAQLAPALQRLGRDDRTGETERSGQNQGDAPVHAGKEVQCRRQHQAGERQMHTATAPVVDPQEILQIQLEADAEQQQEDAQV